MARHAVYSGSRNLYLAMIPAIKSLVANSSVTDVWLLIEDDEFPDQLPEFVHTLNLSDQPWFPNNGPNMRSNFTYMAMVRAAYPEIFPDIDKIVQLDVDTVCVDDVNYLWEVDLGDKWVCMAKENLGKYHPYGPDYYNIGVAVFNLDQMRKDCIMPRVIGYLNTTRLMCVEQDAYNRFAVPNKVVELPTRYNECFVTGYTEEPAIVHFAGIGDWQTSMKAARREYIRKYREMTWDEVMELHHG